MAKVAVCFVCLGNICRSPTAEGVFRKMVEVAGLKDEIEIDSAGTGSWHIGERADRRSRQVAAKRGYDLSSISRQFEARDFEVFDYVLAMDEQNLRDLSALRREAGRSLDSPPKLCLFREFDPTAVRGAGVPDPYYGGDRGFEDVLDMCERACEGLMKRLIEVDLQE
jgi:protein-tyrosine phosphatase